MPAQTLFITGTDTGIGKTWVSAVWALAALAQGKRVTYYKPIQTGTPHEEPPEDPAWIEQVTQGRVKTVCGYCFEPPVTPWVADPDGTIRLEKIQAEIAALRDDCDLLLVEGAGGLLVPIGPDWTMLDLIAQLECPALLVSHVRLGTLNHTLLSTQALASRGVPLEGVVINAFPDDLSLAPLSVQTLPDVLQHYLTKRTHLWTCSQSQSGPRAEDLRPLF